MSSILPTWSIFSKSNDKHYRRLFAQLLPSNKRPSRWSIFSSNIYNACYNIAATLAYLAPRSWFLYCSNMASNVSITTQYVPGDTSEPYGSTFGGTTKIEVRIGDKKYSKIPWNYLLAQQFVTLYQQGRVTTATQRYLADASKIEDNNDLDLAFLDILKGKHALKDDADSETWHWYNAIASAPRKQEDSINCADFNRAFVVSAAKAILELCETYKTVPEPWVLSRITELAGALQQHTANESNVA